MFTLLLIIKKLFISLYYNNYKQKKNKDYETDSRRIRIIIEEIGI